jgi:YgiT-type zinc finger domain-containing protein
MEDRHDERGRPDEHSVLKCLSCGGRTHARRIEYALLGKRGLVMVEDVPAWVCEKCGEQQFDEAVSGKLTELMLQGFPPSQARREIVVPVFSFPEMKVPTAEEIAQMSRYDRYRIQEEQVRLNED